jgi:flagellin-like hook-associated protein FlgL
MLEFEMNKAAAVADDAQTAFATYDQAFASALQLATSFVAVQKHSSMTARESQKLMQTVHKSAGDLLEGRAGMVAAVAQLTAFVKRSNLSETDFGCPGPGPWGIEHDTPVKLSAVA